MGSCGIQYTGSATKPWMTAEPPSSQKEHTRVTRDAYDRLAPVWASTTDDGPFNGLLERPALRSLVPRPLAGKIVLDAGCGSGAQCEWLLHEGADVIGIDLSPAMVEEAKRRCGERAAIFVADLAEPLPIEPGTLDGITCSLALHYLRDWDVPLLSFRNALRSTGWLCSPSITRSFLRCHHKRGGTSTPNWRPILGERPPSKQPSTFGVDPCLPWSRHLPMLDSSSIE